LLRYEIRAEIKTKTSKEHKNSTKRMVAYNCGAAWRLGDVPEGNSVGWKLNRNWEDNMFGFLGDHRSIGGRSPVAVRKMPRRRPARSDPYAEGGTEPTLEDLLHDPVTEAIMRRDGVSLASLQSLIVATRKELLSRELF
jgi:hypothetical protein